jgi:tetratricopeptide (TPR) repeat protein
MQALDSLASWPTADRELRRLELTLRLAQAWSFLGRFPESRTLLEQHLLAMERLHRPDLTGRYYFRLGRTYSLLGDHSRARTATEQALVAAGQAGDRETQGLVYYELAREQFLTGPPRASLAYGQKAVRLLAQTGAQWWLGMAHWVVGVAQALLGTFAPALEAMARAEAIGQSLQDPHIQSYAAFTMGWVEAIRGHTAVGLTACHHARQLAIDPVNLAHAIGALGTAYLEHGDVDQALLWLRQAAEAWQAYRMPPMQAWLTALWADALYVQGDLAQAAVLATQALTLAEGAAFPFARGLAHRVQGRIALAQGTLAEAAAPLRQARELFTAIESHFELGRTYLDSATLAHTCGEHETATRHLCAALSLFQTLDVPIYSARTLHAAELYHVRLPILLS